MTDKTKKILIAVGILGVILIVKEYWDYKRQQEAIQAQVFAMIDGQQKRMDARTKEIRERMRAFDDSFDNAKKQFQG